MMHVQLSCVSCQSATTKFYLILFSPSMFKTEKIEKTIKVTTKQQLNRLVDLIEQNPDIGRGKRYHGSSRQDVKEIWEQIAVELNSLGPPFRTGPEWQRVWIHYKANLKRKLTKGYGGPSQEMCLTATEERVYELTHLNLLLEDDDTTNDESLLTPSKPPVVKTEPAVIRNKWVKTGEAKLLLLKRQVQTQTEILRTLRKLEETKYKEYVLKLKKLELIEKSEERKSMLRELKIKIAEAKLEKLNQAWPKREYIE